MCEHGNLDQDDEDPWPWFWLTEASQCHKQLKLIIDSPYLRRDIGRMSPYEQTAGLESFNKVVSYFAPKDTHFYNAIKASASTPVDKIFLE